MSDFREVNRRIVRMLGLEPRKLTSLDLSLRHDEPPRLTTTELLIDGSQVSHEEHVFEVVLRDEPPFELNRACEAALARIRAGVEASYQRAKAHLRSHPGRYRREYVDAAGITRFSG
jgi:hypothetical protein